MKETDRIELLKPFVRGHLKGLLGGVEGPEELAWLYEEMLGAAIEAAMRADGFNIAGSEGLKETLLTVTLHQIGSTLERARGMCLFAIERTTH